MKTNFQRGLGRLVSPDDRDRSFQIARRLAPVGTPMPVKKTWRIRSNALDQGTTGTCVGHAWNNFLRCEPTQTNSKDMPSPWDIYRDAVRKDIWKGNDHEADGPVSAMQYGTSIRAGAQSVMGFGRLKSYLWAFDLQTALEFILTQGPVVIGVNWYSSFNNPNAEGIVSISPKAKLEGGHAMLWRGADTKRGLALWSNSWGDGWAKSGECWISLRDMERLIREDGEICTAVEQKLAAKKAPA